MQLQPHLKNESLRGFQLQQSTMKTWENTHTATHTHATFSPDTHSWAGMHVIHRLSWALELKPRHSRDGEQLLDRSCSSLCSLFFFFFFLLCRSYIRDSCTVMFLHTQAAPVDRPDLSLSCYCSCLLSLLISCWCMYCIPPPLSSPPPCCPSPPSFFFLCSLRWTEWIFSPSSSFAWLRLPLATKVSSSSFWLLIVKYWDDGFEAGPWLFWPELFLYLQLRRLACSAARLSPHTCSWPGVSVSPVVWLWENYKSVPPPIADLSFWRSMTLLQHHCSCDYRVEGKADETGGGRMSEEKKVEEWKRREDEEIEGDGVSERWGGVVGGGC